MKQKFRLLSVTKISIILLLIVTSSCSNQEEIILEVANPSNTIEDASLPQAPMPSKTSSKGSATSLKTCAESSYPDLGPSAYPQGGTNPTSHINPGTLDVRTRIGGYSDSGSYGKYEIAGGQERNAEGKRLVYADTEEPVPQRWNGTKPRAESFFKPVRRAVNEKTILTGKFNISRLSNGAGRNRTCIIQSHATGVIRDGLEVNSTATSAQFLLYAQPIGSGFRLEIHTTTAPYTSSSNGIRNEDITTFPTIYNFSQDYTFKYETGYDANQRQFSRIKIGGSPLYQINHTYTTDAVYTRYGAYGTGDVSSSHLERDLVSTVYFKDINFCREKPDAPTTTSTSSGNWDPSRSLTQHGSMTSSGVWDSYYYPASYAGDANYNTRWASNSVSQNANHYLITWLPFWTTAKRVKVMFDAAIASDFYIAYYNGDGNWYVAKHIQGNTNQTVLIEGLDTYAYGFMVYSNQQPYGHISIHEFEVYDY